MTPTRHEERIELRVSPEDAADWRAAADDERVSLGEWIRRQCYQAIANRRLAHALASGRIRPDDPLVEASLRAGPATSRSVVTDALLLRLRDEPVIGRVPRTVITREPTTIVRNPTKRTRKGK